MSDNSAENSQEGMNAWMEWAAKCGDRLVDLGSPLGNGICVLPGGSLGASERGVTGYSILQAGDIDEARSLLGGHPHPGWNAACEIEVHEVLPFPGS